MPSFWLVFIAAIRTLRLMVPPGTFRLVTQVRKSFSEALVCCGISGCSRTFEKLMPTPVQAHHC